jgi:uncharacterized protein
VNEAPEQPLGWLPLLRADWTQFVLVHYSLPSGDLAPHTPLELDCRDGRAFVSLVFFRFSGMRPARLLPASLGRALFRPASNNWFLNVRTYVRGAAGPGIQFLVEWIDNPISLRLGPWLYGLPYRRGRFDFPAQGISDRSCLRVTDVGTGEALQVTIRRDPNAGLPIASGTLDGFLLEKYTAYTHRRGATRFFHIAHPQWAVARPTLLAIEDTLIRNSCPWFRNAAMLSIHESEGFRGVAMGPPRRLRAEPCGDGRSPRRPVLLGGPTGAA